MKKALKNYYNKDYFKKRDHLDLHLAETIKILMNEKGFRGILDVGCGTGQLINYLNNQGFEVSGCDLSVEAIRLAPNKIRNKIKRATATRLPFKNESFDLVASISVIEHLTKAQATRFIKEAKRVLKKGGFIFLVTPNFSSPIRYFQKEKWFAYSDPTHVFYYTPRTLSKKLKAYGFKNVKLQFRTLYSPPYEWEFPGVLQSLPKFAKSILTYLLISTRFSFVRNSFWIAAQK